MVVLLDGCGVPDSVSGELETGCSHGLPWFLKSLGTALLRNGEDTRASLSDVLATSISQTCAAHQTRCDLTHPLTPASTVVMLRGDASTVDYLVLSDSTLLVDDGGDEPMVISDDRVRSLALPGFGDLRPDSRQYREVASARLHERARMRNHPEGYPVASTDPQAAYQAVTGQIRRDRVRRALLASDGATRLVDMFDQLTWTQLLDLAFTAGPEGVIDRTREVEDADTACLAWPRGRAYDDATVALCRW